MAYINRLKTLFHQPSKTFQEVISSPSFFKTSILIIVATVVYSVIAEIGLFRTVVPHFVAAYALMFTIIWFVPTLLSMVFFKIMGKKFNAESYMEANALSFLAVLTVLFIFVAGFMIYTNVFAEPKRETYIAMVYYNQWLPMAIASVPLVIMVIHRILKVGRLIANAKIYQTILVWIIATVITVYVGYLLYAGWL